MGAFHIRPPPNAATISGFERAFAVKPQEQAHLLLQSMRNDTAHQGKTHNSLPFAKQTTPLVSAHEGALEHCQDCRAQL